MDEQQLEHDIFLWINGMEDTILEETNDPDASRVKRVNEISSKHPEWQKQHELQWNQLIESGKPILTFEAFMEARDNTRFSRRIYDVLKWHESLLLHFLKRAYVLPPEPYEGYWYSVELSRTRDRSEYYLLLEYMYMRLNYNINLFEVKIPSDPEEAELFWDYYLYKLEYNSDPDPYDDL